VSPPRKATGTKTAASTSAIAITGPPTSAIADLVASIGDMPPASRRCCTRFHHHDRVIDDDPDGEH